MLGDPVETFSDIVDVTKSTFAVCDVWSSSGDVEIVVELLGKTFEVFEDGFMNSQYEVALVNGEAVSGKYGLQFDGIINQVSFYFRCRIITRNPAFVIPANVAIDALSNPEYVAALRNTQTDPKTGESVIDDSAIVVEVEDVVADAFQIKTNYYDYDFEDNITCV